MKFQRYRIIASACIAACGKPTAQNRPMKALTGKLTNLIPL
jgi:hypothetical protein